VSNNGLVRYWMASPVGCGMLIVRQEWRGRQPVGGRIVGGCPLYRARRKGRTLKEFFSYYATRGGCQYESMHGLARETR
jgi:hypothetical protein